MSFSHANIGGSSVFETVSFELDLLPSSGEAGMTPTLGPLKTANFSQRTSG
jgi:hypothetical protein